MAATTTNPKETPARPRGKGKPAAKPKLRLEDLPEHTLDRLSAYDRCTALGERTAGERAAAAAELAEALETMRTALRQFCDRQMLAVDAAAVVIQPAGGLPPVVVAMDEAAAGDPIPACIVPPDYVFRGRCPRGR